MDLTRINEIIEEFSKETHGSSDYDQDEFFIMGENENRYAPFKFLVKRIEGLETVNQLLPEGYAYASYDLVEMSAFREWFEKQFQKKISQKSLRNTHIIYRPVLDKIIEVLTDVNDAYEVLRKQHILLNGKSFPIQLGEWLAKSIFGLRQVKSSSQRGFDFYLHDKRIEVKVHWKDRPSPKGVKVKKSLVQLSDHCILIYLSLNFLIKDICFLDSEFILRKFSGKGHTIFLKESDLGPYFFSKSTKHLDKIVDRRTFVKFQAQAFAQRLEGKI